MFEWMRKFCGCDDIVKITLGDVANAGHFQRAASYSSIDSRNSAASESESNSDNKGFEELQLEKAEKPAALVRSKPWYSSWSCPSLCKKKREDKGVLDHPAGPPKENHSLLSNPII